MSDIKQTIAQRGEQYGDFTDTAITAQKMKGLLFDDVPDDFYTPRQREALEMICTKLARISTGNNPSYEDNWRDIAGYAVLGGNLTDVDDGTRNCTSGQ
ncbi:DUF6378 domain-containing protein [Glaesserella parasuis]|nr:DUF6378 domain-containing protein [Glaesserella parasuis]